MKIRGVINLLIERNDTRQKTARHRVMGAEQVEISGELAIKGSVTQPSGRLQSNGMQLDNYQPSGIKAGADSSGGLI